MVQQTFWVVLPAAGRGARLGEPVPKQFLDLCGAPVVARTLAVLLSHPRIAGVQLVRDLDDPHWNAPEFGASTRLRHSRGGEERMHSVLAGLRELPAECAQTDRVLVHDAARPLLSHGELDALLAALDAGAPAALLALPVSDSLKRVDAQGRLLADVERQQLWRALTPQAFARGALQAALEAAQARGELVTDESQAMLAAGVAATVVRGDPRNLKITHAADLVLARQLFAAGV